MADHLEPIGFWSYSTTDDSSSRGRLSRLRLRLKDELQLHLGRHKVEIFQDIAAIPHGAAWQQAIDTAIAASSFMIPIVTPGFLQSEWCCKEVLQFREREKRLGRTNLIFPFVYFATTRDDECFDPEVYRLLDSRQRFDFSDLRHHDAESSEVSRRFELLATSIRGALGRAAVNPPPGKAVAAAAAATPAAAAIPAPGTVIRDVADGPDLVLVPAGKFTMGVPPQEEAREGVPQEYRGLASPRQAVTIAHPFWLGRYPVTRGQFATFVAETGHETADEAWTWEPDANGARSWETRKDRNWRNPGFEQTDDHPVVCVNHADAEAYAGWLSGLTGQSYRLPSEAEWEYACRAGTVTARFWGDGREDALRHAKVCDRSLAGVMKMAFDPAQFFDGDSGVPFTAPVGTVLPNRFGLYDTLGNVWEWTADCWNATLKGIPQDGSARTTGDCKLRVVRGGSWSNTPWGVRAGNRGRIGTGNRGSSSGFRVARTLFSP